MEQNTKLILLLNLFLQCDLLRCANFNASLRTENKHEARRNDNFMNYSSTDVLFNSTPGIHQADRISPQYSAITTPLGNETITHDDPPTVPSQSSPFLNDSSVPTSPKLEAILPQAVLRSPTNSPPEFVHPSASTSVNTTYITSPTEPTLNETTFSSPNVERSFVTVPPPGFGLDPLSYPAETPPINFDPSVAEFAKKWLQGIASTTANTSKLLVPKLSHIFDYHTNPRFPLSIRRSQKTPQRKTRHHSRAIVRQGVTIPEISKRRHPETEINTFWHDPPTKPTTVTKQRLKPGLLLGKATISAVRNTEDVEVYEKTPSGTDGRERIMRMHRIPAMTMKQWYSDRTEVQLEQMETTTTRTGKQYLRQIISAALTMHSSTHTSDTSTASTMQTYSKIADTTQSLSTIKEETRPEGYMMVFPDKMFPPPETTKSTKQSYSKMKEIRQETSMIVFLVELSRLVATKEKKAVHDVLKHTDQIIHGFYKSGQMQWFGQPLIDVTRKLARSLKESDIDVTLKQAADLQHTLSQRRRMLSDEVNTILEAAGSLYDDDEGAHLLEALNEFAAYPNTTLSSYWLCNSLINNFLRPYRRLTDTRQRQQLMDSVNNALKTRLASSGANETTAMRSGGVRHANVAPVETELLTPKETTRTLREKKKKRHHRSRKRKRGRKRYRMQRYRPDGNKSIYFEGNTEKDDEDLMLRSMVPRTNVQPSVLVTT